MEPRQHGLAKKTRAQATARAEVDWAIGIHDDSGQGTVYFIETASSPGGARPILMIVLSLVLPRAVGRWVHIVLAALLLVFNAVGLPGYPGLYDRFLTVVGLGINVLTIVIACGWKPLHE